MRALIVCLVLVGCGGGNDDAGNVDAAPPGGCTATNDTCAGETICVQRACVAAFPRVYALTNIHVTVPTTDPNGAEWDAAGGAPDLFVTIAVNATVSATTTAVADQFSATFAGPHSAQLIAGSSLAVTAFDEDLTTDDLAFACVAGSVTAAQIRARDLSCTNAGSSLTFSINPQ